MPSGLPESSRPGEASAHDDRRIHPGKTGSVLQLFINVRY